MNQLKLLKGINYLSITITIVLIIIFFGNLLGNDLFRSDERFFARMPHLISLPLLLVFSIIITVKTQQQKGVLLFALFLSLITMDWTMQFIKLMNTDWVPSVYLLIANALTGTIYIKALQNFPRQVSEEDVVSVFPKNKILAGYIKWSIKDYTWFAIPLFLAGLSLLKISEKYSDLFVLITALLGLYVNYKNSSAIERNKILWLFWGLITFTFIMIIISVLHYSATEISDIFKLLFNSLLMLVLLLSLMMSLFFSDAFDTGIIIRRTIVDGSIFILIVIIYNTVEHYFLHWLSHKLHISDVILSSLLSGIFVLAFSPIHHKFMAYLEKKVKKH